MLNRFHWFLLLSLLILLPGCAHVISEDLRANADPSLTFSQVHKDPNIYKDKFVVWGGEIIETVNQKDKTTLIEVFQRPLGRRGEPEVTLVSEGRFLILSEKYLDPYIFQKGRKITVAGEILGEKTKPIGEMDYRYTLLSCKQLYLWPYDNYLPYPFIYDPWSHYDPWRGYPYMWHYSPYHR